MEQVEIFRRAKQEALAVWGYRDMEDTFALYHCIKTMLMLEKQYIHNRELTVEERLTVYQLAEYETRVVLWGARKLRSRAQLVEHLMSLPVKFYAKFGEDLATNYFNHLHAEALAAHKVVYGRRRGPHMPEAKVFNAIKKFAA